MHNYVKNGFKLIVCRPDKSPVHFPIGKEIITKEEALELQKKGELIGAVIPEDVVVLNINRDKNIDKDGLTSFKKIKEKWDINFNFVEQTYCVSTPDGGFHVFFRKEKDFEFEQGIKAPGIELKTEGYIIVSGCPGYTRHNDFPFAKVDNGILEWLKNTKSIKKKIEVLNPIPSKLIKKILSKVEPKEIPDIKAFAMSIFAIAGNGDETLDLVANWLPSDNDSEHNINKKNLFSAEIENGITINTFIDFLLKTKISKYLLRKITTHETINNSLMVNQDKEINLPFENPDCDMISDLPCAREFFDIQAQTFAADILEHALSGNVIYIKDDEFYFFGGSRWEPLYNVDQVIHTILFSVARFFWQKNAAGQNEATEKNYIKIIRAIGSTGWKAGVLKELRKREKIHKETVDWDSPDIKESITTYDGVIDFKDGKVIVRDGFREEYRKSYIDYFTDDIIESEKPEKFISFMKDIFVNVETCETAKFVMSMCISGNAGRRLFHLWEGGGANGKSTLIEIIQKTLGTSKSTTYPSKMLLPDRMDKNMGTTPELHELHGAYAAFGVEAEQGKRFSCSMIKNLTGGDTITVNPKYRPQYTMLPTWQLIMAVNDLPGFDATDNAFIERLCILPFNSTFCKTQDYKNDLIAKGENQETLKLSKDRIKIIDEIMTEKCSIIKWMIEGYVELENKHNGIIPQSKECINKKKTYIRDNNDTAEFIEEMCIIDKTGIIYNDHLTEVYRDFIGNDKISTMMITRKVLSEVERQGVKKMVKKRPTTGKTTRCLVGIRFKDEAEFDSDGRPF